MGLVPNLAQLPCNTFLTSRIIIHTPAHPAQRWTRVTLQGLCVPANPQPCMARCTAKINDLDSVCPSGVEPHRE